MIYFLQQVITNLLFFCTFVSQKRLLMSTILSLETSGKNCSVALFTGTN